MDTGSTSTSLAQVVSAITDASSDVTTQGIAVIGVAVGIGILFWAAKLIWGKFKSMAK